MPGAIAQGGDEAILRLDWARDPKQLQTAVASFQSHEPFRVFTIDDFLDESLLSSLESELEDQLFYVKENDLFSFLQSGDLAQSECPTISKVKKALYSSEFRSGMVHGLMSDGPTAAPSTLTPLPPQCSSSSARSR